MMTLMMTLEKHFKYRPLRSKEILLVDDEGDLGWIMKKVARDAGHRLTYASTLKEGLAKFKSARNLDIAIVDLRLENESGLKFIRKAKMTSKKVLFIMISAFGTTPLKTKARRLGIKHFLDKPLKLEKLLDIVNHDL